MKRRKIIAAIVLLGGAVLFFVIISAPTSSNTPLVTAKADRGGAGSLDYTVNASGSAATGGSVGQNGSGNGNLTDAMIQSYAQNILQMNNGFAGATPNATNTVSFPSVDTMTSQLASSLDQTLPSKTFASSDVVVESDNSTSSDLAYLQAFSALSAENFSHFKYSLTDVINQFISNNDPTLINQYISVINNEISGLLTIPVPSNLASWHLANLNLWEEKLTVFTAILNIQSDPLKAYIGLNDIDGLVGQTQILQNEINAKLKSLETA